MTREEKQKALSDWYNNLPACLQAQSRAALIEKAEITKGTFYNYVMGRTEIPNFIWNNCISKFVNALEP